MVRMEQISFPPKSSFGFFAAVPFWGANSRFRKEVKRKLLARSSLGNGIDALWSSCHFSAQEIRDSLDCIRVDNGWPNALFLPSDSFLALAPLEGHYEAVTADNDTVNDLFFVLNPAEKERMKSEKGFGARFTASLVHCGDIPLIDTSLITPENTIADVLRMLKDKSTWTSRDEQDSHE